MCVRVRVCGCVYVHVGVCVFLRTRVCVCVYICVLSFSLSTPGQMQNQYVCLRLHGCVCVSKQPTFPKQHTLLLNKTHFLTATEPYISRKKPKIAFKRTKHSAVAVLLQCCCSAVAVLLQSSIQSAEDP